MKALGDNWARSYRMTGQGIRGWLGKGLGGDRAKRLGARGSEEDKEEKVKEIRGGEGVVALVSRIL